MPLTTELRHSYAIYRGILTGCNEAFIIDNQTKEELVRQDPRSAEILKPVLRGRDIKRYQAKWANLWLIATLPSLKIDIDNYQAVKGYLLTFGKERLEQTGKILPDGTKSRKKTPHQWFELQDTCAYHEEFEKEKIVYPSITKFLPFIFDKTGKFTNDKCFIISGMDNLKYLIAILNSKVGAKWLLDNCPELGSNGRELRKVFFSCFPAPKIEKQKQEVLVELVEKVIYKKLLYKNTTDLEDEIDQRVYEIYGFTSEEVKVLEKFNF